MAFLFVQFRWWFSGKTPLADLEQYSTSVHHSCLFGIIDLANKFQSIGMPMSFKGLACQPLQIDWSASTLAAVGMPTAEPCSWFANSQVGGVGMKVGMSDNWYVLVYQNPCQNPCQTHANSHYWQAMVGMPNTKSY